MNNNPRNSIPILILTGYTLSLLAVLGLGWYSSKNALHLQTITQDLYTHPFAVSNAAAKLDGALFPLQSHIVQVVLIRDEKYHLDLLRSESEAFAITAREGLDVINANFLGDMNRVRELELKLGQWDEIRLQVHTAVEKGDYETAEHLVRAVETPIFAEIVTHVHYILSFALDQAKGYVEESGSGFSREQI